MVSKSSSTRTIRLQNELWEWLAAEAERTDRTVNWLVGRAVAAMQQRSATVARISSETNEAVVPSPMLIPNRQRENNFPTSRKVEQTFSGGGIQIGPTKRPYGSLQKKGKGK